ncbi:carbon-nitrogen hydrolase family protein [Pedobacter nyackensis]|uniref:Uncharacterized protein n=1 Tax=Pedobacter nyackensis TaxID=475255 RepID=A0A1W2DWP9_9SPHI|nr:hypothetical protein [Pedobacter nyackensis]SMD01727.1 hypothetical protein SAMN04488101_108208 [Pedobacter nyackensis]
MNFIILGTEIPDYTLPMIEKYNSLDESQIVSEDVKMYNAAKMLTSDTYVIDMEQTRLYYKQKVYGLKVCFDRCLLSFGKFDIPSGGLGVWIPFDKPVYVDSALLSLVSWDCISHLKIFILNHTSLSWEFGSDLGSTTLRPLMLHSVILLLP